MMEAEISSVEFELYSDEVIRRQSVCEVTVSTLYDRGVPRDYSINDMRMGTADRRLKCSTCANDITKCVGHPGHLELAAPVYHVSFMPNVLKILRSFCPICLRLLLARDKVKELVGQKTGKIRFLLVTAALKSKKICPHSDCKFLQPKYKQSGLVIKRDWGTEAKKKLTLQKRPDLLEPFSPKHARDTLSLLEQPDLELLGLGLVHPKNFIISTLLVPPPIIRPAIMFSESNRTRGQDDLTHKLQEILKTSNRLKLLAVTDGKYQPLYDNLGMLVAAYINSDCSGIRVPVKKRSGMPEKCIVKRFKGKRGRVRGNLQGKRVDFSARSVISPDPQMSVDEIGIPRTTALKLTFKEKVTTFNVHKLTEMVRLGPDRLDGAKSIIDLTKRRRMLHFCNNKHRIRLHLGWEVERYMRDGDWVLFNRQPSLRYIILLLILFGFYFFLLASCLSGKKVSWRTKSDLCLGKRFG